MAVTFIHLSDIHFGQEKGGEREIHDDVKERLLVDAATKVKELGLSVEGIIVTGDVAFAGKVSEFTDAGRWLDRLARGVGCAETSVQVVPGNHDIDRDTISDGCRLMLDSILQGGETTFDKYLNNPFDCETLYRKLGAYLDFAEGYNCFLDKKGGIASNKLFELAPGRSIRIMGLNSSLMCWAQEKEGDLFLGGRQRVLPIEPGEELVILCHHPLNWFNDGKTAQSYIRNRARVLMTGHEHSPSVTLDTSKPGRDLLTIASGAAVPPHATEDYGYTYNILTFDWDAERDALKVMIVPRTWSDNEMDFIDDVELLKQTGNNLVLASKNFREAALEIKPETTDNTDEVEYPDLAADRIVIVEETTVPERFAIVLLKFFRDLSPSQRMRILVRMEALPPTWKGVMTHGMERNVIDKLMKDGRIGNLEAEIEREQADNIH
ncbi:MULTISPECIES: metallophosphoesterase [Rhizobium/Agrobacterium group]|uniref:metallophosphoesterase n=1 Tax=Rhizobium/Agrobacterium group TaxID=227290 RepID=UPI0015725D29|nr:MULTISPECIES: metallophosphoesterase [Rhizobium/Agrobacterium group]NSZ66780.1 metallophosphoesterase [Agrobacterium tumefaciens]NTA19660.1 metallophosphoesterase [Agrobacterium tumefaciens]NTA73229.1 metallophosphoesterase [Agrobacterium tumefaciens]NTJ11900.1 metallophosphoesterase [Rhizobium lusitanum]WCK74991.1 metallophosphoesterase [Agrobacterium tumefaciens]